MSTSICFTICKQSYQQITGWQQEINQAILCHQLDTRGQALVTRLGNAVGVQKIYTLPAPGEAEPYFGALGGAYRFTFHPVMGGCELEVFNLMGGFAFYYPERFEPLRLFLFDPPEITQIEAGADANHELVKAPNGLFEHDPQAGVMRFHIPPLLYQTFSGWAWSHRPLHAYDFIFVPDESGCLVQVRTRESSVTLELAPGTVI